MKSALVIQHVAFEGLGTLESVLLGKGYGLSFVEAPFLLERKVSCLPEDLLIILGGPIGVYETSDYPFLTDEMRLIEKHIQNGGAFLGICLGSQILAHVLGARVYPGGRKEIGWSPLSLTQEGVLSPLSKLGDEGIQVLHWHGDTFDLPSGSTLLASSSIYPHQAFSYGDHVLGLQFHCEVSAHDLERWYIGHTAEISGVKEINVRGLREAGQKNAPALETVSRGVFEKWLGGLEK